MIILAVALVFGVTGCKKAADADKLWENAVYTQNTALGSGKTQVNVEVKAGNKSVTFTVNTDKELLGDALTELKLISGDMGEYGLYVKTVNGITADYSKDNSYWGIYKNGEMLMTGIDATKIADGEHYELVYSK